MDLQKSIDKVRENDAIKKEIERAREAYAFKPFVVEYRNFALLLRAFRWVLGTFSIITGFGLLYYAFLPSMHYLIAGTVAVIILSGIELLKNETSLKAFKNIYQGRFPVLGLPALGLFGLSVFLSVNGVQRLHDSADESVRNFQAANTVRTDSLHAHYDQLVKAERESLAGFKQSVSWRGRVNITDKTTASVIAQHEGRITALQQEKAERLKMLSQDAAGALNTLQAASGFNRNLWLWLSVGVEITILLSLWFLSYYQFRAAKDADLLQDAGPVFTLGLQDMGRLMEFLSIDHPGPVIQHIAAKSTTGQPGKIGFNQGGLNSPPEAPSDGEPVQNTCLNPGLNRFKQFKTEQELRDFLAKYAHVVDCINEGFTVPETVEKCKVSRSTVFNVKRCLAVLGE